MAENPYSVAVPNVLQALMAGEQGYKDVSGMMKERATLQAREQAAQEMMSGNHKGAIARLMSIGDMQGANTLSSMGNNERDFAFRQQESQRAQGNADRSYGNNKRDFAFRQQESQRAQDNADRSYGLQEKIAKRQETPAQLEILKAAGIDPSSQEGRNALFPKTNTPISAVDKKAIFDAEDALPQLQGTKEALTRAREINDKTFTGYTAGVRGDIGTKMFGGSLFVNKNAALATSEWQKIMGPEALEKMANTLKGATTDFELKKFIEMLGDPATDPKIRKSVIERMERLTDRMIEIQNSRVKDLRGGNYFKPGGGQPSTQSRGVAAPPSAQAALKADPSLRGQYEAKYGPGSAAQVLGQ